MILLFTLFSARRILNSIISWPLQPMPPPAFTSLTGSYMFVSMRFNRASPLFSCLAIFVRKLLSTHSRDTLDCLCPAVLPFQLIPDWFKFKFPM